MQPASPGMRSAGCDQSWSTAYHAPNPPPPHDFTPAKSRCSSMCVFQPLCAVVLKTQSIAKGRLFEV